MKAHDGNADDGRMAMEALRFMESRLNNQKVCLVADCKIVYEDMVNRLIWDNYPFVSKCPENFGDNARRRVLDIVRDRDFTYMGKMRWKVECMFSDLKRMLLDILRAKTKWNCVQETMSKVSAHNLYKSIRHQLKGE